MTTHRLRYDRRFLQMLEGCRDDEQIVDLMYVGPKADDLHERLGIGRRQ